MLGYLLALVALIIVVALLLPVLAARRAPRPRDGGTLESDHPVARTSPSADEANPSASVTATPSQRETARRHTPPA